MIELEISEAGRACRVARYAAGLACFGLLFDLLTSRGLIGVGPIETVSILVTGALFALLWRRRHRPSLELGIAGFLLVNAAVIASLWVSQQRLAESGVHWVPFRANQLGALAVAMLAPTRPWIGILTIAGFTGSALVQFAMFDPAIREHMPYGDPWATLAFGGFAIGLLVFRLRATRIEREIVSVHVRMADLERFTRTMLAVRDLANTPLQTLKISVDLLRLDRPETRTIADRIERAVNRLEEIERLTSAYDGVQPWPRDAESFESNEVLRESVAEGAAPPLGRAPRSLWKRQ